MTKENNTNEKYFTKAIKGGKLVHISEVENGLACGCICPCCETPVIAHNNPKNKNAHHFKHQSKACQNYYETMLHFLAKEIIEKNGGLVLPNVTFYLSSYASSYYETNHYRNKPNQVVKPLYVQFDKVEVEKYRSGIKPDLIGYINNKELYIEIAVTHFIDDEKKNKIKESNLSVIEIDLSSFERNTKESMLNETLSGNTSIMKWVNNPIIIKRLKLYEKKQNIVNEFIKNQSKEYKVYGENQKVYCPLINNKEYEASTDNCDRCIYMVEQRERFLGYREKELGSTQKPELIVNCVGKSWKKYEDLLTKIGVKVRENKAFGK